MKITGISYRILEFDASSRFGGKPIPKGRTTTWQYPLFVIHTDAGIDGYSMGYGPHGDGLSVAETIMNVYLQDIEGGNPLSTEEIWQKIYKKNRHLYHQNDTCLSILDVALWDIKGKALGVSITELLGSCRKKVKAYASGHVYLPSEEEIFDEAKRFKKAGYHAYKLQLWQGPAQDIPRFYAAREAVGDDFLLMQDASAGYQYVEALRVGKILEKLNFYWFEEPIFDRNVSLLHRLDRELRIPLLVGETSSLMELSTLLNPPFGILRGDVLIKAGITGLQKAFAMCQLFGINLEIHSAGTPLLDIANLHVACANANCEFIELHHPVFRFGICGAPLEIDEKGYLYPPQKPGLGIDLDWDWIDNHTIDSKSSLPVKK